jgi:VWFA-related protein
MSGAPEARSACRRAAGLVIASCVLVPVLDAQRPPLSPRPSPNSRVDLVLVDLRVTRGNEPVTDLQPGEVTLLVDGVARPLVSLIAPPIVGSPTPGANVATVTTANTPASNALPRRVVLVVDRESLDAGETRQLQASAEHFIARLPREVRAAVASLPLGSNLRFDADRAVTVAALRKAFDGATRLGPGLEGSGGFGCTGDAASEGCGIQGIHPRINAAAARAKNSAAESLLRGRRILQDLQSLFRALGGGTPADVVIVSGMLPFDSRLRPDIDRTFDIARTSAIRVHAVEIADLTRVALPEGGPETPRAPTLEWLGNRSAAAYGLPEDSGGSQALGAVSAATFFEHLAEELSSTYLLSFELLDSDRTGTPHGIEIRIARPALTIHARKAFIAPPASLTAPSGTPDAPGHMPATAAPTTRVKTTFTKTDAWIALATEHQPGTRDRAVVDLGQWSTEDFKTAVSGLGALRRQGTSSALNDALAQLVLIHTDLALLAPDLAGRFGGFEEWETLPTLETEDGQAVGRSVVSAHWRLARVLLNGMQPHPADDPRVRDWYRAVGATLLADRDYAAALPHLRDAQRLFPRDRDVNMLSGVLYENLAAAAAQRLLGDAQATHYAAMGLQRARKDFSRALEADPQYEAAELHLARVCHLLGDEHTAGAALAHLLARSQDHDVRYLAELLTGSIDEAGRRFDAALESYERAAALHPGAQTPLVALSHLARLAGRRSDAVGYIDRITTLPASPDRRNDPWWRYDSAPVADHVALLTALRATLRPPDNQ